PLPHWYRPRKRLRLPWCKVSPETQRAETPGGKFSMLRTDAQRQNGSQRNKANPLRPTSGRYPCSILKYKVLRPFPRQHSPVQERADYRATNRSVFSLLPGGTTEPPP